MPELAVRHVEHSSVVDLALSRISLANEPMGPKVDWRRNLLCDSDWHLRWRRNDRLFSVVPKGWAALRRACDFGWWRCDYGNCRDFVFSRVRLVAAPLGYHTCDRRAVSASPVIVQFRATEIEVISLAFTCGLTMSDLASQRAGAALFLYQLQDAAFNRID